MQLRSEPSVTALHLESVQRTASPERGVDSLEQRASKRWLVYSAVACVLIAISLWIGPYLLRPDLFADDVAQHTFWMYRYIDPALFPNDLSVEYFSAIATAPWGYRGLYALLAHVMDIGFAAKLLAVVLLALSGWLAWRLGAALVDDDKRALRGLLAVTAACSLVSFGATDLLTPMAFQRSFALPLSLLCLWALTAHRYRWVGISWLLCALVYPPIIPVLGSAAFIVFAMETHAQGKLPDHWLWNALLGLGAVGLAALDARLPPGIGPTATYAQAMGMPEFGPAGRMMLYDTTRWTTYWLRDDRTGLGWTPWSLLAMALAVSVLLLRRRIREVPMSVWAIAVAGVVLFVVARLAMFHLYLPNRQSRWSLGLFGIAVFAAAGCELVRMLAGRLRDRDGAPGAHLIALVACAAPLIVASVFARHALALERTPVNVDLERAYGYIAGLRPEVLVAAHPDLADFVPYRARHSVLASTEEQLPFHLGYYERLRPKVEASLRAAYATDWQSLDAALGPYGARVFLTGPSVWTDIAYYAPFDGLVRELRAQGEQHGFVLQHPSADRVLFRSGEYYVVRVGAGNRRKSATGRESVTLMAAWGSGR